MQEESQHKKQKAEMVIIRERMDAKKKSENAEEILKIVMTRDIQWRRRPLSAARLDACSWTLLEP